MIDPHHKKCHLCDRPLSNNKTKYCPQCSSFAPRLYRLPHKAAKAVRKYIRKHGYVCYYTGMLLDLRDPHSPWYCVFDHWRPHDPHKIVLTSSLLNDMKSDLTESEFWSMIRQLAAHRCRHTKIRKIKLSCWDRDYSNKDLGVVEGDVPAWDTKKCDGTCHICGKRIKGAHSRYCSPCAVLAHRIHMEKVPIQTIKNLWDYIRKHGLVCYYTGMPLVVDDSRSPWYFQFDHWRPHDPGKLVLTSALINDMKSDLSEEEFWYYILQFANYKDNGTKVRKRSLAYWCRLTPVEDI